ncbi:MAG: hypothetical protein JJU07_15385 [Natronohydrobacter sp.]|nr:hypothetical protein [Natronohydrobacter sp.]
MGRGAAGVLLVALAVLAACDAPTQIVGHPDTQRIEIGPDLFHVRVMGDTAIAANFSTGSNLVLRVEEGARKAIAQASGCAVESMTKYDSINRWQARLAC